MTENQPQMDNISTETVPDIPYSDEEILSEIKEQKLGKRSWLKNLALLLISLFIFFSLGLFKNNLKDIIILILVLLIHEAGHFIGMHLFRYRNVQMFFIPFLGAAVSGHSHNVPVYKKALVSLLGPVPGIILGLVCLIVYIKTKLPLFLTFTLMLFLINGFNLLPLFPLDGGRFMQEVIFCRNRYLESCFRLLASLLLIAAGYFFHMWLIALIGVFTLLSVPFSFKIAGIVRDIRRAIALNQTMEKTAVSPSEIDRKALFHIIVARIHRAFPKRLSLKKFAGFTADVFDRIYLNPPRLLPTLGLLTLYLVSLFFLIVGATGTVVFYSKATTEKKIVEYQNPNGDKGWKEQTYLSGKLSFENELTPNQSLYHGRSVSYYENGAISEEGLWCDGKWDGEWKEYDRQGKLTGITVFDKGKFVLRRELKGNQWIDKTWEEIPFWFRKSITKQANDPPDGPETENNARRNKSGRRAVP